MRVCLDFTRFGGELLSHALRRSTIAAAVLNFRVRDGTGCFTCAMTTKPRKIQVPKAFGFSWFAAGRIFAKQMPVAAPELCHEDIGQMRSEINQHRAAKFVRLGLSMFCVWGCMLCFGSSFSITGSNQAYRTISTGQLSMLPCLHLRPIDVVVYHGPQGYLVLRGASRLDAFSGYPVRT